MESVDGMLLRLAPCITIYQIRLHSLTRLYTNNHIFGASLATLVTVSRDRGSRDSNDT